MLLEARGCCFVSFSQPSTLNTLISLSIAKDYHCKMIREAQKPDKSIIIRIAVRDAWLWKYLLLRSVRCEEGRWRSLPTRTTLDQSAHCVPRRFSMGHYNQPVWDATTTQYGNATTRYGALQAASKVFYHSLWDTTTQYGALQPACMGSYYQYHISTSQYALGLGEKSKIKIKIWALGFWWEIEF